MRVFTNRQEIVELKHFRYCTGHYQMLLTLQQEAPNMLLEIRGDKGREFVPIHRLDLDDQFAMIDLNPGD
jgi:hypothetical protein